MVKYPFITKLAQRNCKDFFQNINLQEKRTNKNGNECLI